jgi:uncharacterized protein YcfJ
MKKLLLSLLVLSSFAQAQEVRYANIVSVTPVTDNVKFVKQQCANTTTYQNQPGIVGRVVGVVTGTAVGSQIGNGRGRTIAIASGAVIGEAAGAAYDNAGTNVPGSPVCRNIVSYEPTFGGFEIVYELDGHQYSTRSMKFPQGNTIPVKMQPAPLE